MSEFNWRRIPGWHKEPFAVGMFAATLEAVPQLKRTLLADLELTEGDWEVRTEQVYLDGARRADLVLSSEEHGNVLVEAKAWGWFSDRQIAHACQYERLVRLILLVPDAYRKASHAALDRESGTSNVASGVLTWQKIRLTAYGVAQAIRETDPVGADQVEALATYLGQFLYSFKGFSKAPDPWAEDDVADDEYKAFLNELRWRVALDHREVQLQREEGKWRSSSSTSPTQPWPYKSRWMRARTGVDRSGWVSVTGYRRDPEPTRLHVELNAGSGPGSLSLRVDPARLVASDPQGLETALTEILDYLRKGLALQAGP